MDLLQKKFTKIVSTIGPKTGTKEMLSKLIDAGINVMRLNFSHGSFEEHGERIKNLRDVMNQKKVFVAILVDTPGPEIRTGNFSGSKAVLKEGEKILLLCGGEKVEGTNHKIWIDYENLPNDVKVGDKILIDDGMVKLEVLKIDGQEIEALVLKGGEIKDKRGVNLPGIDLNLPGLTQKDKEILKRACVQDADYVALSFVRDAQVVNEARNILKQNGGENIKIIAKIENAQGVKNFEEILKQVDGIMVARGDMGTEIPYYEVPIVQKMMIKRANDEEKVIITATEMLQTMVYNPRPTRAEVSDVANAIFDGTDAVMLSAETASPSAKYPVETVQIMSEICKRVDKEVDGTQFDVKSKFDETINDSKKDFTEAIAMGAVKTARNLEAKYIVAVSETGRAVRKIRKYFPNQTIIVFTHNKKTASQVALIRGAYSYLEPELKNLENVFEFVRNKLLEENLVDKGDVVVCTCAGNIQGHGKTDMMKILKI